MSFKRSVLILNLIFFQIILAQNSKKWIVETDTMVINTSLSDYLNESMSVPDSVLNQKTAQLIEKLNEYGYFDAVLDRFSTDSTHIIKIKLNQKIDKISLNFSNIIQFSSFSQGIFKDENRVELPVEMTSSFINYILKTYQNDGFPFVKVKIAHLNKNANKVEADIEIVMGKQYKIDKIIVKGYENFPPTFIKNKLQLYENQVFNKSKIENISTILRGLSFVSEIKKPEILFTKDSTYLYLFFQKENSNAIDGIIGFSNSETYKGIELNGYFDLKLNNVFNKGEQIALNWRSDGHQSQSLETFVELPYLFKTPLVLNYELLMYKKDSTFFNFSNKLNLGYFFMQNHQIGFEWDKFSSQLLTSYHSNNSVNFSSHFYGIFYQYVLRNPSKLFPHKFMLKNNFLTGKRNGTKQINAHAEIALLFKLNPRQMISLRNETAVLVSDDYFENELFRIGGIQSVRGFQERSLLAKRYTYINIGYHFLTDENSYFSLMSDYGQINADYLKQIYSIGVGYKYGADFGNFHLQYFIGNSSDAPFSIKNSFLHLNFSQKF